jgi:hypothetical protein
MADAVVRAVDRLTRHASEIVRDGLRNWLSRVRLLPRRVRRHKPPWPIALVSRVLAALSIERGR